MNSTKHGAREAEGNEVEAAPGPPFKGSAFKAMASDAASDAIGSDTVTGMPAETEAPVNYEEAALLEREIDGTEYRLDVGRAGTALCISTRPSGSWSWVFRGEARWQAGILRCKSFDRPVLTQLSAALAEAASSQS
jgi:hypothetical protein